MASSIFFIFIRILVFCKYVSRISRLRSRTGKLSEENKRGEMQFRSAVKGAGQFDWPKNYEHFGGLVKHRYIFD